jgi:translation initiation factor IF-1
MLMKIAAVRVIPDDAVGVSPVPVDGRRCDIS